MKGWFAYWGALLVKSKISDSFRKELLAQGKKVKKESNKYNHKLAGAIKEEYIFKNFESWFMPKFMPILENYEKIFMEDWHTTADLIEKPFFVEECELWINYQKCKEFNPRHYHGGDLSFVIYLQIPKELVKENKKTKEIFNNEGTGTIHFHYGEALPFAISGLQEMPKECEIYMFPSWMQHSVTPFFSDVERITVAGNLTLSKV